MDTGGRGGYQFRGTDRRNGLGPGGEAGYVATHVLVFRELPNLLNLIEHVLRSLNAQVKQAERPKLNAAQRQLLANSRKRIPLN